MNITTIIHKSYHTTIINHLMDFVEYFDFIPSSVEIIIAIILLLWLFIGFYISVYSIYLHYLQTYGNEYWLNEANEKAVIEQLEQIIYSITNKPFKSGDTVFGRIASLTKEQNKQFIIETQLSGIYNRYQKIIV